MPNLHSVITLLTVCRLLCRVECEYFTSVVGLETLLKAKEVLVRTLEKYLRNEEERLGEARMFEKEYRKLFQNESSDGEGIVTNPVNAYLLIKRLTADWQRLKELLKGQGTAIEDVVVQETGVKLPSEEDLEGAVEGLIRLQKTYKLNTADLTNGNALGIETPQLSAGDCFEIGTRMLAVEHYEYSAQWMEETLHRLDKEPLKTASKVDALETLAYSIYKEGNMEEALRLTKELLELAPDHARALDNKEYYEYVLSGGNVTDQEDHEAFRDNYQMLSESLCRGEKTPTAVDESKLKCRYSYGVNPYFLFHPFKVEELFLEPQILLYHKFLSNKEMDTVLSLAEPRLERAGVASSDNEKAMYTSDRVGKVAWLKDDENATVKKISQRIESATGLSLSTAEDLQVLNYGIGGHYEFHFDFAAQGEFLSLREEDGDRIATWLNYMSDVKAGGATAFPEIGVSVKPEKGAAVLWFNLLKNGTGDTRTRHAACPVLLGSKWISNKWIHERGQEFLRKCGLKREE